MDNAKIDAAIGVASVAGLAGLLLPSIDDAWNAHPADGEARRRLSAGEQTFFLILLTVAALQSLKSRSWFPLIFGSGLGVAIAYTYERALGSDAD